MRPLNLLIAFCLVFPLSVSLADDQLRPVTHEEVWLMKRLGSPVISPDGTRAVVSVTEPAYEDDGTVSDLWLIELDGSRAPQRLTTTPGGESGAAWSPDGTRLAFSAARNDGEPAQIFILPMDGPGEAEQITAMSTGAANPVWSPDGSLIAFESTVYPGAVDDAANVAEHKAREERGINVSRYEIFPIRQWDRWRDELQTRLFIQSPRAGAEAKDLMVESELVSSPGFSGVPALSGDSLHAVWTPDGNALVISATDNLHESALPAVSYHLYRVPAGCGLITALTTSRTTELVGDVGSKVRNVFIGEVGGVRRHSAVTATQAYALEVVLVTFTVGRQLLGRLVLAKTGQLRECPALTATVGAVAGRAGGVFFFTRSNVAGGVGQHRSREGTTGGKSNE